MNDLVPLHFEHSDIRMIVREGSPWWVLRDLCVVLGIRNHRDAATRLWDWQKDGVGISDAIGRQQKTIIVNEAGAWALILDSKRPEAEKLARWLFIEVLPSIREFGAYPPPKSLQTSDLPALEPVHAPEGSTPTQRFFEEVDRVAVVMLTTPENLLKVLTSVQTVRMMRLHGEGLDSILKKAEKVRKMASAGFDMPYILRGERTMTREERGLVAQLREVDSPQRGAAFKLFSTQLPALAIPPVVEIEEV